MIRTGDGMIDPNKPVRFRAPGTTRIRIAGNDGMGNHRVRYHTELGWQTATFDANGWDTRGLGMAIENYEIDWDRPLAFIDTGERGHLAYFPGTQQHYGVSSGDGSVFWYEPSGAAIHKLDSDGNVQAEPRQLMNIKTAYTRRADAARRVAQMKIDAAENERNPLWAQF